MSTAATGTSADTTPAEDGPVEERWDNDPRDDHHDQDPGQRMFGPSERR